MQIRLIPYLIFHKSEKFGGWVGMAVGGGHIAYIS